MAFPTFEDCWREVRQHAPLATALLCRRWVQDAYNTVADSRGWFWSIQQGQLTYQDAITLDAVTVTVGSTTVTSVGLFTAAMAGRQFRTGSYPIYTVQRFIDANTIELDMTYQSGTTGATEATILDVYTTLPEDFGRFFIVADPVNQRFIPWWMTSEELTLVDPNRTATGGPPRCLIAWKPSTYPPTLGRAQYTYWPIPTAQGALQYQYVKRPKNLVDSDIFHGVLGHRTDILVAGALAKCAKWPGTPDVKNPYFNLALAKQLEQEFQEGLIQLDLRDDDQLQQSLSNIPWERTDAWTWAYNTHLLQATDATLGAYAGYGNYQGFW